MARVHLRVWAQEMTGKESNEYKVEGRLDLHIGKMQRRKECVVSQEKERIKVAGGLDGGVKPSPVVGWRMRGFIAASLLFIMMAIIARSLSREQRQLAGRGGLQLLVSVGNSPS